MGGVISATVPGVVFVPLFFVVIYRLIRGGKTA